jgi:hypothetical protein
MFTNVVSTRSPDEVYSYPATAYVLAHQGGGIEVHEIWYAGAPAALFDNAPNGSVCHDTTNNAFYQKGGTLGLKDGSWVEIT